MSIFGTPVAVGNSGYPIGTISNVSGIVTNIGDLIVVFCANLAGLMGTVTCSDTAGNTYTHIQVQPAGNPAGDWFYCLAATHASGSNTITVNSGTTGLLLVLQIWDFPITGGVPALDFVAPTVSANYAGLASPGSIWPNNAVSGLDELVLVTASDTSRASTYTAGYGFTLEPAISGPYAAGLGAEHLISTHVGTMPSLLQHAPSSINGAVSGSKTLTFPGNVTAGSTIMVQFRGSTGTPTVSDSQGNSYYTVNSVNGTHAAQVGTTGACTVTISGITASTFFLACACEIGASPGVDSFAPATGGSGNPNNVNVVSRSPNDFIVANLFTDSPPGSSLTYTASGSTTLVDQQGNSADGYAVILDEAAPSTGSSPYNIAVNCSVSGQVYDMAGVSFWPQGTPWISWTGGSLNEITAIFFKNGAAGVLPPCISWIG